MGLTASAGGLPRGALAGLRVVEVSSFVAAPLGGMTLAQLGADVIRVDPLGGAADLGRWPLAPSGVSLYWTGLNKGKRSITVDFRGAAGQELVTRLVTESGPDGGILLTNAVGRDWLGYERLRERRPDLIHVRVQGYPDGRPAVDYTVNAELGFPLVTGPEGHAGPVNHVLPAWDVACGLYAAVGVLAAERLRRRTGRGEQVSVALADVALATAANLGLLAEAQLTGVERQRIGNHLYGGFARDFQTRDGRRVMIVALTRRHWQDLLAATGTTDTFTAVADALHADFATEGDRFRHREVIAALLGPWFAGRDLAEVRLALAGASLPWSVYRGFTEVVGDGLPELLGNPMLAEIEQPGVGRVLAPGSPLGFTGTDRVPAGPAPRLGGDTDAVLTDVLGLTSGEIEALRRAGTIGDPS
ncbi:2-methylfumaryl-CoA isomerase [Nonomuraea sp. NN258]|uniref:CoA transferase n=1 Tax=Nonomuraea antri TaxID=2730852 RepID=UPI00156A057A|nr:CoA transferase [Nonomuraea antri]NRQ34741.1 2-methylfumaryl-CoA isomerase [Nonomuraea antri]